MRITLVIALSATGLLTGCNPMLKPKITANTATAPARLVVVGTGFSTTPKCASVSVLGMPSGPPVAHIADPSCTGGSFKVDWDYSYVSGCSPNGSQTISVLAVDNPSLDPAAASTSVAWGPNCAFAGTCGKIGQYPCPSGCLEGSVVAGPLCSCGNQGQVACTGGTACQPNLTPVQQGSSSICQPCGGEQQPLCSTGTACQTGLHSQLEGANNLVCEASCGYGAGVPCTPAMVAAGMGICAGAPPVVETPQMPCVTDKDGQTLYRCFDSTIAENCVCQQSNSCQESASLGQCTVPGDCTN
jgi:hypothetical protein